MKQLNCVFYKQNLILPNNQNKLLYYLNSPYLLNLDRYFKINKSLVYSTTHLLLNNLLTRGLKQKFFLSYCKSYKLFYLDIALNNNDSLNSYYYYSEFKYNLQFNFQLYNIESCIL